MRRIKRRCAASSQLRAEVPLHTTQSTTDGDPQSSLRPVHESCIDSRPTCTDRPGDEMPRDFHQGLFFMLGLLLAFYVLLPLIGAKV